MPVKRKRRPVRQTPRAAVRVVPRVKVWIEVDGSYVLGRGISEILKAVDACGSIKQAAATLGKSYRHVWQRVKEAEQALGRPLVDTHVGGKDAQRSHLTELGRALVEEFDRLRDRMHERVAAEFSSRLESLLRGS